MSSIMARFITPYALAIGLGFTSSSFFTWANVGSITLGIPKALTEDQDAISSGIGLDPARRVQIWAWFFRTASVS
jgi:hypothetical protein